MGKVLNKVKTTAGNVTFGSLKFMGVVGLGVTGAAVAGGMYAKHSADKAIDGVADALCDYLINGMALTRLEEKVNFGLKAASNSKKREGVNWSLMSASMDDGYQYGR